MKLDADAKLNNYRLISYGDPVLVQVHMSADVTCNDPAATITSTPMSHGRVAYLVRAKAGASIKVKKQS